MQTPQNPFKRALKEGRQQYGFWLGLANPVSAEICGHCGYDWLLIDAEHAPNDMHTIQMQLLAIGNTPSHPVLRIVEGNTALIKQVLDMGAQSLLVPMVDTAEQAKSVVSAVRYPPNGVRGVGTALSRGARWNIAENYLQLADQEICVLIQVESVKALENLDEILAVEGIDGVFVGPADLAATMGHLGNPGHPDVVSAVKGAIATIRAAGIAPGILVTSKALAKTYEQQGAQFIALGVDTVALANSAKSILANHLNEESPDADSQPQGNGAY